MNQVDEVLPAVEARNLANARNLAMTKVLNDVKRIANVAIRNECEGGNYHTTLRMPISDDEGVSARTIIAIETYFTELDYDVVIEDVILYGLKMMEIRLDWSE